MRRFWRIGVLVAAMGLGVASPVAHAEGLPALQSVELRNGLRVILAPDPRAMGVDLAVWYPAGTITEPVSKSGTTNLLAQLMFLGSEHFERGKHIERIRAEGGAVNSLVNPDYATFFETIPHQALDLAIELEADRMRGLTFRDPDVDAVREGVRARYQSVRASSPLGVAVERLYALAFAGHPYGWPVSGREEDLDHITPRDLRGYHKEHFAPDGAVVTVVGRFEPESMLAALRKQFEGISRRGARAAAPKPPGVAKEKRAVASAGGVPMLLMGWRGPGAAEADPTVLELVAQLLVASQTSRLLRDPVAPGAVARGELDVRRLASLLYCAVSLAPGADTAGVERAVIDRAEALATDGCSDSELTHAKKRLEATLVTAAETSRGRAQQIGLSTLLMGDPKALEDRLRAIRSIPASAVQAAAKRLLSPDRRYVVWLVPESGATGGSGR